MQIPEPLNLMAFRTQLVFPWMRKRAASSFLPRPEVRGSFVRRRGQSGTVARILPRSPQAALRLHRRTSEDADRSVSLARPGWLIKRRLAYHGPDSLSRAGQPIPATNLQRSTFRGNWCPFIFLMEAALEKMNCSENEPPS